jgi:hypothetical protein
VQALCRRLKIGDKMGQTSENQLAEQFREYPPNWATKVTHSAPNEVPPIISKKWLCGRFECQYPNGRFNYSRMYRLVLTDDVIRRVGLEVLEVRRSQFREFDAVVSHRLKIVLNL